MLVPPLQACLIVIHSSHSLLSQMMRLKLIQSFQVLGMLPILVRVAMVAC